MRAMTAQTVIDVGGMPLYELIPKCVVGLPSLTVLPCATQYFASFSRSKDLFRVRTRFSRWDSLTFR